MLFKIAELLAVAVGFLLLLFSESLDMLGRMETVEKRWPRASKVLSNRPARLVLLALGALFLVRDFKDAAATAPPPIVRMVTPAFQPSEAPRESPDSLRK